MSYFSRKARLERREKRLAAVKTAAGKVFNPKARGSKLTTQNAGPRAIEYVRGLLAEYALPGLPSLSYSGTRKAHLDDDAGIIEGVVTVMASMKTPSGIGVAFDVPVLVREGEMIEPSVLMYNGVPKIIAQSTFDTLLDDNSIMDMKPERRMYGSPDPKTDHKERHPVRRNSSGLFSLGANRQSIRDAIRLGSYKVALESEYGAGVNARLTEMDSWGEPTDHELNKIELDELIEKSAHEDDGKPGEDGLFDHERDYEENESELGYNELPCGCPSGLGCNCGRTECPNCVDFGDLTPIKDIPPDQRPPSIGPNDLYYCSDCDVSFDQETFDLMSKFKKGFSDGEYITFEVRPGSLYIMFHQASDQLWMTKSDDPGSFDPNDSEPVDEFVLGNMIVEGMGKVVDIGSRTARRADRLPGGVGDDADPEDFDAKQLGLGVQHEMEHTKDPAMALEVGMDHLTEDGEYYDECPTCGAAHLAKVACEDLDPAERPLPEIVAGADASLSEELEARDRGGVTHSYKKGQSVKVIRDLAGDGKQYVVEFDDGLQAIVDGCCLK